MQSVNQNKDFLNKIREIIEENISNEQFGVSELADKASMSRSNLLRKIKKETNLSVSQFIRNIRLKHAMEMLKDSSLTVSEISFKVGFSSTSYFIKCFHDHYGFSPGEAGKYQLEENAIQKPKNANRIYRISLVFFVIISVILSLLITKPFAQNAGLDKSIAVLPFKNDSNDSTNVYIINGLMESILNNLQKIENLKVISRTSVEKYRMSSKTIPEIAKELNVSYIIEGSGQKIGDKIMLNIQLIEGSIDKHLWAKQYTKESKDIFTIQKEVAKNIADEIQVIITPEEEELINKSPTNNPVAYDYYLKGMDLFYKMNYDGLMGAIFNYEKALEHDPKFAEAYAGLGITYYFLDFTQTDKIHSEKINLNADKALLFDAKLDRSLIAKALYYMNIQDNEKAIPYLEKALEYNPNSALVLTILSEFYTSYIPNTKKYLEYAIKGIELNIAANDSSTTSFIYLHLSNAFIQTGFVSEAEKYINKSLEYNSNNLYSDYLKAYILYAKNGNLEETTASIVNTLKKDTSRLDILQEVGKLYYYLRDYENSYTYYRKFIDITEAQNMTIYQHDYIEIAIVLSEMGYQNESDKYLKMFKIYAENDKSIYSDISMAFYYTHVGDTEKALEYYRLFSEKDNFHYWTILFTGIDPIVDDIKELPEFQKVLREIEEKFWKNHKEIKASLKEKGLMD